MLGNKTRVLIDEFDFSGAFFAAETEHTVAELENTVFGAVAMTFEPGLASDKLMLRGYYAGNAAGSVFRELRARMGAGGIDVPIAILIDPDDANCMVECSPDAWGQSLKISLAAPELITFELSTGAASNNAARGIRLREQIFSATGSTAAIDLGAAGVAGGWMYVFVHEITGTATGAVVRVQSSDAQAGTFTDDANIVISAVGGYAARLRTGIGRWSRVNVTNLGGASALRITVIVCVSGVTY